MTKINYNNGKVYKIEPIIDHDEGDIYIGSTTKQYLSQRMTAHRAQYNQFKKNKVKINIRSYELFNKYGVENCNIILLELVNVNSKEELLMREAHYIKTLQCVNKVIPLRTLKEHYIDNKEKMSLKNKQYRDNNKEKIKQYRDNNKEKMSLHKKDWYKKKKELKMI